MNIVVKRAYGTPWSKLIGEGQAIGKPELDVLGKTMVKHIVLEAKKDFMKKQGGRRTPRGVAEGIPGPSGFPTHTAHMDPAFFDSFGYKILGNSTVQITSTWPFISQITEGRKPFKMTWLTQANGVKTVPIVTRSGEVIFRTAPFTAAEAWVHPGFARHSFIERGIRKGRLEAAKLIAKLVAKTLAEGNPFK